MDAHTVCVCFFSALGLVGYFWVVFAGYFSGSLDRVFISPPVFVGAGRAIGIGVAQLS